MRYQAFFVLAVVAVGAVFATINLDVVFEARTVRLLWGQIETPLVLNLLIVAAAVLLLMLLLTALSDWRRRTALRRLEATLTDREQEIVALKGRAYDEVFRKVDEIHRELSGLVSELRSVLPRSPEDDQPRSA